MWQLAQECRDRVTIHKVPAHADSLVGDDEVLNWAICQNRQVDAAAHAANLNRPSQFWETWNRVRLASNEAVRVGRIVQRLHASVAYKATRSRECVPTALPRQARPRPVEHLQLPDFHGVSFDGLVSRVGTQFVTELVAWLTGLLSTNAEATMVWISAVELRFDLVLERGRGPPVYHRQRKTWVRHEHATASLPARARWFAAHLREVLKAAGSVTRFCAQ